MNNENMKYLVFERWFIHRLKRSVSFESLIITVQSLLTSDLYERQYRDVWRDTKFRRPVYLKQLCIYLKCSPCEGTYRYQFIKSLFTWIVVNLQLSSCNSIKTRNANLYITAGVPVPRYSVVKEIAHLITLWFGWMILLPTPVSLVISLQRQRSIQARLYSKIRNIEQ